MQIKNQQFKKASAMILRRMFFFLIAYLMYSKGRDDKKKSVLEHKQGKKLEKHRTKK